MHVEENIPLAPFTTLGVGGSARWFVSVATENEIVEAVAWAASRSLPIFTLGGGSNLLVADEGFGGLVLRVELKGMALFDAGDGSGQKILQAAAGESWQDCVARSVRENCSGIECLAGIPGSVGGTPVQNVGAYGQEVSSSVERVRAYDMVCRETVEIPSSECEFAYRRSRFNGRDSGRYIVTRVDYRLTPGGRPAVRYADLERELERRGIASVEATLLEVADAVTSVRRSKGMLLVAEDVDSRSAGSFFKNPVVSEEVFQRISVAGEPPPRFPAGTGCIKIPAAWLIEHAGFKKGSVLGAAGISSRHSLALINRGGATAHDVLALAAAIRAEVNSRFGIELEMEPVAIGFATSPFAVTD